LASQGPSATPTKQVFERFTKEKARCDYRLLILDGHSSHLTSDFIHFCDGNRILLAIFPLYATYSLQPLDVVLFAPLSKYYSQELDRYLHRSQGLTRVTKRDFFGVFWPAWGSTMTWDNILKSFQATDVWPMDADAVLKRFKKLLQSKIRLQDLGIMATAIAGESCAKLLTPRLLTRPGLKPKTQSAVVFS
jgi:hypothetical protein